MIVDRLPVNWPTLYEIPQRIPRIFDEISGVENSIGLNS